MRALVRPFLLFTALCAFTVASQARAAPGVINTLVWTQGFPKPTVGGVDVSVDLGPAAGWKCTNVTLRVVDAATNKTLGEYSLDDPPGNTVATAFTGLASMLKVRVTADAIFQGGGEIDPRQIQTFVTTK